MVKIEKAYAFDGPEGKQSLKNLLDSRRQLIIYHFMFDPEWDKGCSGCVGEAVAAAIDGLWLYWVLGLASVNQELVVRVRTALEDMLARSMSARSSSTAKARATKRSGGRHS